MMDYISAKERLENSCWAKTSDYAFKAMSFLFVTFFCGQIIRSIGGL